MRTIRKSGITALTAAIALSLGAVPVALTVPAIVASEEAVTVVTPATASAGTVSLTTTSAKGTVAFNGMTQEFTGGQQCQVTPIAGGARLLNITGSVGSSQTGPAVAGFRDGAIGVFETSSGNPDNASQCFRVDAGSTTSVETLELALDPQGPYSDAPFSDRLLAESATIDARVANSKAGDIRISLQKGDGTWVPLSPLATWRNGKAGDKITNLPSLTLAGGFKAIRLAAIQGSFSLFGANLNLVSQADAEFCPEDTYPEGAANFVEYVGETTGTAGPEGTDTFGGDCFGISLTDSATELRFLKPLDVSPDAQFLFTKTWTKTGSFGTSPTLAGVDIDFEFSATAQFNNLPYCPAYLYKGGTLTGFTPSNPASTAELADLVSKDMVPQDDPKTTDKVEGIPDDPATPVVEGAGTQFACLGEPRDANASSTQVQITDRIYLVGDARINLR